MDERLVQSGPVLSSSTVVILESGAVGLYASAVARCSRVPNVVLFGTPENRLDVGLAWGADPSPM